MNFNLLKIKVFGVAVLTFLSTNQCADQEQGDQSYVSWSSYDPVSIPYRQRFTEFERGNLVKNPSFETGRIYSLDSLNTSFQLNGWKRSGEHVYWVNTEWDSVYSPFEAFDGTHSIKIDRKMVDETINQGEGIISDFIKVIPGNYLFTYYIRLENIKSNQERRGTRIFDAVDIRLLFYDKNKLLLDGRLYNPYSNSYINNSFKGYSFSNFWSIDRFGWAKVKGRSYTYPFSEGEIPDEAKYVKVFLGLKGTGTMWVDLVDLRYSRWNFTPRERMEPYFDSVYSRIDLLVPTPKSIIPLKPLIYFDADHDTIPPPMIILPENPDKPTSLAADLLYKALNEILRISLGNKDDIQVSAGTILTDTDISSGRLIFSIGRNRYFLDSQESRTLDQIAGHDQGYMIFPDSVYRNLVFLIGNKPIGDYYAATTALQLLDDSSFVYSQVKIVDYPDFEKRSYLLTPWANEEDIDYDIQASSKLSSYKLNKAYAGYVSGTGKKDWFNIDPLYKTGIKAIGQQFSNNGTLQLAQMVNPYYHFEPETSIDSLTDTQQTLWFHSNPEHIRRLISVFNLGLEAGAKTIMLCAGDYVPYEGDNPKNFALYAGDDIEKFVNLQSAHISLINQLYEWKQSISPETRMEFLPPWYSNEFVDMSKGRADQYFDDLTRQIPEDVAILWSGRAKRSLSVDKADLKRFSDMIGRSPVLWDNSLSARGLEEPFGGYTRYYPGKARMCNIMEPYDVMLPDSFYLYNDSRSIFVNGPASGELYRIKYATVADYEWNVKAYNPDYSLWKVLVSNFGEDLAREIILFNDTYYELVSVCMFIEFEGINHKYVRSGEELISKLNLHLEYISGKLKNNPRLINELIDCKDGILSQFQNLINIMSAGQMDTTNR